MQALIATFIILAQQSGVSAGQSLLDASYQKLSKLNSLSLEAVLSAPLSDTYKLAVVRGGYMRMASKDFEQVQNPDGIYILLNEQKQYQKMPAGANDMGPFPGLEPLFGAKPLKAAGEPVLVKLDGVDVYRVKLVDSPNLVPGSSIFIGKDSMPAGFEFKMGSQQIKAVYKNLKTDEIDKAHFAWSPPEGWKEMAGGSPDYEASLLAVGTVAPDFKGKAPDGKTTSLTDLRKGKKATLINFWFYG